MKPEMDSTNREMSQKVKLYFAVHHASRMKIRERERVVWWRYQNIRAERYHNLQLLYFFFKCKVVDLGTFGTFASLEFTLLRLCTPTNVVTLKRSILEHVMMNFFALFSFHCSTSVHQS